MDEAIKAFVTAQEAVQKAQYRLVVVNSDLERHIQSLKDGVVLRTDEMQVALSLDDILKITYNIRGVMDVLLSVPRDSEAEGETQSNDETAKRVIEILNAMEAGGEFDGMSEDEKAVERQMLGMRLRR